MAEGGKVRTISNSVHDIGQRFVMRPDFQIQYFSLYNIRLNQAKQAAMERAREIWGTLPCQDIVELKHNVSCAVAGILMRVYKKRPSVIEKYIVKIGELDGRKSSLGEYYSPDDQIYIEDHTGRIRLDFGECERDIKELINGTVIAIKGSIKESALIQVKDFCFPSAIFSPYNTVKEKDEYVCFISGLEIGNPHYPNFIINILTEFIQGNEQNSYQEASEIVRLVILGDSIFKPDGARVVDRKAVGSNTVSGCNEVSLAINTLDTFLSELAGVVYVDLMPGDMDPSYSALPQQPFTNSLFPLASKFTALKSVTNPYEFEIDGLRVLCSSGQNVDCLKQYIPNNTSIEVMDTVIKTRHLAPIAPDGLSCIPVTTQDPFIIQHLPHVFVAGNQERFATGETEEGVKLISVPKFCDNEHSIVMLNLRNLEVHTASFTSDI